MPKATFIMPSIRDTYLGKAVASIQSQTMTDWELILFDNKKDRRLDYDDDRIRVIDCDNCPLVECFNLGTELARSPIIMHHCDDDISFPERAELTVKRIYDGLDMFVGGYIAVSANMKIKYMYNPPDVLDVEHLILRGNNIPLFVAGYRKDRAPKYRPEFPELHDYVFMLDFLKNKIEYSATMTPLAFKICHGEAFGNNKELAKGIETKMLRKLFKSDKLRSQRKLTYL